MAYIGKTPASAALTSSDISDGIIITDKLAANAVVTSKITDGTIATADIANSAITNAKVSSTLITGQTAITGVANDDLVLISDTSGSAALKKMTVANLVANAGGGKIGQVVTQTLTTVTSISAGSFVATGLTLNITPSASNSKIYLIASISTSGSSDDYNQAMAFFRGSTIIGAAANAGNRIGSMSQSRTNTSIADSVVLTFVDSPSSTSQLTYTVKLYGESGITHYVNRTGQDADEAHKGRTSSTITALEVLA